jgi:hypothetical protein
VLEGDQAGAVLVQVVGEAVKVLKQGGEPAGRVLVVQGFDEGGIAQAVPAWPDPLREVDTDPWVVRDGSILVTVSWCGDLPPVWAVTISYR